MSDVANGTHSRRHPRREGDVRDRRNQSTRIERTEEIIRLVWDIEKQIDTVVALGVGTRCDANGEEDHVVAPILEKLGYKLERAKTNIGLGRISNCVQQLSRPQEVR